MEDGCNFLFEALQQSSETSLTTIQNADRCREDSFSLAEVLAFLPEKRHADLADLVKLAVQPSLNHFVSQNPQIDPIHESNVRIAVHIVWLLVQNLKHPPATQLGDLILLFHEYLLKLPAGASQNIIAQACEWFWRVGDPRRAHGLPQTLLYLLMRSFGDETYLVGGQKNVAGGKQSDVRRVYAMRKAFLEVNMSTNETNSNTIHNLLLRCATSRSYLSEPEGRKFIAFLLAVEDIRDYMFDVLVQQLSVVRKSKAALFGNVFLQAWTTHRSDWLVDRLLCVSTQTILAQCDPFATNLRTVLSSFHINKRMNGIDLLLHRIYSPTLFGNLLVANPLVRRNAVTILADAFPIHDPGALKEEIDNAIQFQSSKLMELLTDPAPIVRCAAATGVCRVLGMLWELVPPLTAKKMIDIIVTKLAFDASSIGVRFAVLDGLRFLLSNHLSHSVLAVALPQLRRLSYDKAERVKAALLDLLLKVKEKRLKNVRYFDIVPVDDLVQLMAFASSAISTKVIKLIVSSYFPITKPGKSVDEVLTLQVKACLSLLDKSEDAAKYFYQNVYLYVSPGPLCEFSLRLAAVALDVPQKRILQNRQNQKNIRKRKVKRRSRQVENNDENEPPEEVSHVSDDQTRTVNCKDKEETVCMEVLLSIVADILASVWPSLGKEKNAKFRDCLDDVFGGAVLKTYLVKRGNSIRCRAACWRIASCISVSKLIPVTVLWREQIDAVTDWPRNVKDDASQYKSLLSAMMLCAFRWKMVPSLIAVVSGWSDCASRGHCSARVGLKTARLGHGPKTLSKNRRRGQENESSGINILSNRVGSLFALQAIGTVLIDAEDDDSYCEMRRAFETLTQNKGEATSPPGRLLTFIRKGSIGAIDHVLETLGDGQSVLSLPDCPLLLKSIAVSMKGSLTYAIRRESQEGTLLDLREVVQWLAGEDLWKNISRVGSGFGTTLMGICLGPIVDGAALQRFSNQDLLSIEIISKRMSENLKGENIRSLTRGAIELLRLAVQLNEQSVYFQQGSDYPSSVPTQANLGRTAVAIFSNVFGLLSDSVVDEGQETGNFFKPGDLQGFICNALLHMSKMSNSHDVCISLNPHLMVQFRKESYEKSFLASTVCIVVPVLLKSSSQRDRSNGFYEVFHFIWNSLNDDTVLSTHSDVLLCFLSNTVKSMSAFCEESDLCSSLITTVHEFMGSVEKLVEVTFSSELVDDDTSEEIIELREMITKLKNCRERGMVTD